MNRDEPGRQLLESTIRGLDEAINRLTLEREAIDERLQEMVTSRQAWERRLGELADENTNKPSRRRRARKGENLRRIKSLFDGTPNDRGLTVQEIMEKTGIPWSSVRNELQREKAPFEERDGLWHLRNGMNVPGVSAATLNH